MSNDDGGHGDGHGDNFGDELGNDTSGNYNKTLGGTRKNEFTLANPRNITIVFLFGRNLNTNPYLPFNKAIRRLILSQGSDGDVLLRILDKMEVLGATNYDNIQLQTVITKYPKAAGFDSATKSASLNWTTGIANNLVSYGVHNGSDAWRTLYNRYIPLVEELQHILIQELMALKPVTENDIDTLFNDFERIIVFYTEAGSVDDF